MILLAIELGVTAVIMLAVAALAMALADQGRKFMLQFGLDLIQLWAGWKQAQQDTELREVQLEIFEAKQLTEGER